jgi:multiple sugar transport system ATP-binding protein
VALGRAIVRDPAVFLLDEPLSNLDAKLRVQTRAELSKLHHRLGTTFVYVTHDQVEAMTMATRLAVMNLGRLQQVGTPAEVYDRPVNMFVAGFIGSPAINFLEMQVLANGESLELDGAGYQLPVPAASARALQAYAGRNIVFGVRPEDIHDAAFRPPGFADTAEVQARVTVVEHLGAETILYATSPDGTEFVARVDARTGAEAERDITLGIEMANMHAFDPETTLAIREGGSGTPNATGEPVATTEPR